MSRNNSDKHLKNQARAMPAGSVMRSIPKKRSPDVDRGDDVPPFSSPKQTKANRKVPPVLTQKEKDAVAKTRARLAASTPGTRVTQVSHRAPHPPQPTTTATNSGGNKDAELKSSMKASRETKVQKARLKAPPVYSLNTNSSTPAVATVVGSPRSSAAANATVGARTTTSPRSGAQMASFESDKTTRTSNGMTPRLHVRPSDDAATKAHIKHIKKEAPGERRLPGSMTSHLSPPVTVRPGWGRHSSPGALLPPAPFSRQDLSPSATRPGFTRVNELDNRIAMKTGMMVNLDGTAAGSNMKSIEVSFDMGGTAVASSLTTKEKEAKGHGTFVEDFPFDLDGSEADGLAVAKAVSEDDNDGYIPSAIEYDPDAKPPIYKNRRFRMYGLLACSMLGVIGIAVAALLVQNKGRNGTDRQGASASILLPSGPPTSTRAGVGIQEQLELVVGSEKLSDPTTPQYQAMEWIIDNDELQLSPSDPTLVQRFILGVFYFDTHQEGEWLSCNAPGPGDDDTCVYKEAINSYPLTYIDTPWVRWLSSESECGWAGIHCDEFGQVRGINLEGQQMGGTLPADLALLPFIQGITLSWNNMEGTFPAEIATAKHVILIEVHFNRFSGNLDHIDWSKARSMQLLNFGQNELTGTIPSGVVHMNDLRGLYLNENFLTGTIPSVLGEMNNLALVRLHTNYLTGTIPPELYNLDLQELWLFDTAVYGSIPPEVSACTNLRTVQLENTNLSGTIPEELYDLQSLTMLKLDSTNIEGTISTRIGNLINLFDFRVYDTKISGTIPSEIGLLPIQITGLRFEFTNLNGTMPLEVCEAADVIVASCTPSPTSGIPDIECDCCSVCCSNEEGRECTSVGS